MEKNNEQNRYRSQPLYVRPERPVAWRCARFIKGFGVAFWAPRLGSQLSQFLEGCHARIQSERIWLRSQLSQFLKGC